MPTPGEFAVAARDAAAARGDAHIAARIQGLIDGPVLADQESPETHVMWVVGPGNDELIEIMIGLRQHVKRSRGLHGVHSPYAVAVVGATLAPETVAERSGQSLTTIAIGSRSEAFDLLEANGVTRGQIQSVLAPGDLGRSRR